MCNKIIIQDISIESAIKNYEKYGNKTEYIDGMIYITPEFEEVCDG